MEKKFYLFGSPISKSPSPTLHNTGFQHYGLNCKYELCDTLDIQKVWSTIQEPSTAGGSVTIPHKVAILPFLSSITPAAQEIGAVNTVYKVEREGQQLVEGDNTDWIAIRNLSESRLREVHGDRPLGGLTGLVIGAGGTAHAACYALKSLGIPFFIYNRSAPKAQELAHKFNGTLCETLGALPGVDVVIGTVPPSAQFALPEGLVKESLVVVELVYAPRETALVAQARKHNCKIVEGSEILFEQGIKQFHIFTNFNPPKREIAHAIVHNHNNAELSHNPPRTFSQLLNS
uniref:Shikimate dehydrogenase substrate binding N-terminal domain-containing protein n=1 Tax=Arcella intermedia TaxID=1963864 RepID=A0A6B2LCD4_9EUKA